MAPPGDGGTGRTVVATRVPRDAAALMPPPAPRPQQRARKQKVLDEDEWTERLDAIIDLKHPLVRLAELVPWSDFDAAFGRFYKPVARCPTSRGAPRLPGRAVLPP